MPDTESPAIPPRRSGGTGSLIARGPSISPPCPRPTAAARLIALRRTLLASRRRVQTGLGDLLLGIDEGEGDNLGAVAALLRVGLHLQDPARRAVLDADHRVPDVGLERGGVENRRRAAHEASVLEDLPGLLELDRDLLALDQEPDEFPPDSVALDAGERVLAD